MPNAVKVICTYFGDRRHLPQNSKQTLSMLKFWWETERELDNGVPLDVLVVINKLGSGDVCTAQAAALECDKLVVSLHGKHTRNGSVRVIERDNIGLSFGAYSDAFRSFANDYDYWFFTEDDGIIVNHHVVATAVRQLKDPKVGFVATVGCSPTHYWPAHAHGGVGITRRDVLQAVCDANGGKLPYWNTEQRGADGHEEKGEIVFTNSIHKLGYELRNLDGPPATVVWGQTVPRTELCLPWLPSMERQ